jgi:mannobiose 2-epimerase
MNRNQIILAICSIMIGLLSSCTPAVEETTSELDAIKSKMQEALGPKLLQVWYPRTRDTVYGGFLSDFDYEWKNTGPDNKFIVTQARHVWTASKAAGYDPGNKLYPELAAHGFRFLRDYLWDQEYGGFYELVDREGTVIPSQQEGRITKRAYGNAFAIYGLAAYYHISGDTAALNLAQRAFNWLEEHSHDPEYGGYFQFLERDGTPMMDGLGGTPPKDQNSSIHLLEAFTELYGVWKDETLRERLEEMLILIRDTITTDQGYLTLFLARDWTPLSYRDSTAEVREAHYNLDHVSFGHDVETAYLMMEASHTLGLENDTRTLEIGKKMVDHTLKYGWDDSIGGIYDEGYYFAGEPELKIIRDSKNWWAQSEMLNTMLIMHELYPDDEHQYLEKFKKQWAYCRDYLIDWEHGGWYAGGLDKQPERKTGAKAQIWKGPYHTARSLMNCIGNLEGRPT